MKKLLFILTLVYASQIQAKSPLPEKITGLKSPESVVQADDGNIYISEINEFGKDGDGQISKMDNQGHVTVFAKGMDDPKGLTIVGDKLYVADKTRILEVNSDGSWQVYAAESAFPNKPQFFNDLEADPLGNLYVSDSGDLKSGGAIYKITKDGIVSTVADSKNPDILAPNGLLFEGRDNLLSVDFESGILYRIKISTGKTTKIATGFGGGDGIVKAKSGRVYISDWKNGNIYLSTAGKARIIKNGFNSPADIALSRDGKRLLIPVMKTGELEFVDIK